MASFPMYGSGKICGIIMSLFVDVVEKDYDNDFNYLLSSQNAPTIDCPGIDRENKVYPVSGIVKISITNNSKIPISQGTYVKAKVWADCVPRGGVNEAITDVWATYPLWLCDATKIEIIK
jgi:hypothetical protein